MRAIQNLASWPRAAEPVDADSINCSISGDMIGFRRAVSGPAKRIEVLGRTVGPRRGLTTCAAAGRAEAMQTKSIKHIARRQAPAPCAC
jgi:hypothetical protein